MELSRIYFGFDESHDHAVLFDHGLPSKSARLNACFVVVHGAGEIGHLDTSSGGKHLNSFLQLFWRHRAMPTTKPIDMAGSLAAWS